MGHRYELRPGDILTQEGMVCVECGEVIIAGGPSGAVGERVFAPIGPSESETIRRAREHEAKTGHNAFRKETRLVVGSTHGS